MFSGNAINHKAVRDKISTIASDAARKWDEITQLKNIHPTEKGAIEVLKEPLISPVVDRT